MAGNINVAKYCVDVSQALSSALGNPPNVFQLASLLDRGELLDLEFCRWSEGLPQAWLSRKTQSSSGETLILYPDVTLAGVWNYYRGTRITLLQNILRVHRSLDTLICDPFAIQESGQLSLQHGVEEIIMTMVSEICQSIPFALGDVDHFGCPTLRAHGSEAGIKGIQGFALLWPPFGVLQCGYATNSEQDQARKALQHISSTFGIRLGLELSHGTVQLNRRGSSTTSRISVSIGGSD